MPIDSAKVAGFAAVLRDQARRLRLAESALTEQDMRGEAAEQFARIQIHRARRVLRETLAWVDREFPVGGVGE